MNTNTFGLNHIITPQLTIRDPIFADLPGWHQLFSNKHNMHFVPQLQTTCMKESRTNLQNTIDAASITPREKYFFTVELTQTGEFLGSIGFTVYEKENGREGSLGWFFLPEHHGRGYATQALLALIPHMFEHWGITHATAGCNIENQASERVMQKAGMAFVRRHDNRVEYQLMR